MSAISLKSISGITSITTPAGVDDQLTLHTNDTTQRVKVTQSGIEVVGVATFQDIDVDGNTNLDNVNISGVTTATTIKSTSQLKLIAAAGNSVRIRTPNDDDNVAVFNIDAATHLYYDSQHKFSTVSDGIRSIGNVTLFEKIIHDGDPDTYLQFTPNTINLHAGGTTGLTVYDTNVRIPTKLGINGATPSTPLDVIANTSGYAMAIRGRSSDNIGEIRFTSNDYGSALYSSIQTGPTYLNIQVGSTTNALRIDSSGNVLIGTTTLGHGSADDLTINNSGNGGITIRTGTTNNGAIFFADSTSGDERFDGFVQYNHGTDPYMIFGTNTDEKLRIDKNGKVTVKSHAHDGGLELLSSNNNQSTRLRLQAKKSDGTSHDWYLDSARSVDRFTIHDGTTSWFTILGDGKVGIGTATPSEIHTVHTASGNTKQVLSSHAGFSELDFTTASTLRADIFANSSEFTFTTRTAIPMVFRTNGANERLRINSDGQLLHTANKSSQYTARFVQAHADNPAWLEIDSPADNNLRPAYIQFKNAGTDKWGIGQVYNPTGGQSFHISNGTHNQTNSKFVIMNNGDVGVNVTPAQASKFCAYAASGTTAAFLKSNTGASIALGGLTQPRILLEAAASQSDLQIYTSGGSSWGTPTWSKKATFTSGGDLTFSNNQNLLVNNSYTDGNMTIGANVGTNAFTAIKGSNHTRIENYSTVGSASWIERFRVYTHGYYHSPVRHADSVETKLGGRYYVISGATPLDGDYDDNTYTPLMRCGHSFNGIMYLWLAFNGDEFHRGCSQHIIMCQGTYGYVSNSTRRSNNVNALGTGMGNLEFAYQNTGSPNYYFKVRATWTNGENQPYVLWTWVGHNSAYPYAL